MENITSTNPIKPSLVKAYKELTGCSRVTLLKRVGVSHYRAHLLSKDLGLGTFSSMGYWDLIFPPDGKAEVTQVKEPSKC